MRNLKRIITIILMFCASYLSYYMINISLTNKRNYSDFVKRLDSTKLVYYNLMDSSDYYNSMSIDSLGRGYKSYIKYHILSNNYHDSAYDVHKWIDSVLRVELYRTEDSLKKKQYGIFYTRKYK